MLIPVLLLSLLSLAPNDTVIADFENGRFDGWVMTGNCWGSAPENSRFAGRTLTGWQGAYFLSSAHAKGPGWDANSGTGRALSLTFRITRDTIQFRIAGGRQYGRCGIRLLVEGEEVLSETGETPFQMRTVTWDVRSYHNKSAQIEVFDNAATGAYAYVHVDDIILSGEETLSAQPVAHSEEAPPPAPVEETPSPDATGTAVATPVVGRSVPPPRSQPAIWDPFPTHLGPRPPIAPYTTDPLPTEKIVVPMIFPLLGGVPWHDNYNDDRGEHRHTAIDIQARKMYPIIAPFSGVLGFKVNTFWIYGDNGYKCLGTHLNDDTPGTEDNGAQRDFMFAPNLRPGDRVIAGQFIGYVGNSGNTTGPHLHFEIFSPEGLRSPAPSLRAAQRITAPRLNLTPQPPAPSVGELLLAGCPRGFEAGRRILTVQMVALQKAGGKLTAITTPRRYYLRLTPEQVASAGGTEGLKALPRDRAIYALAIDQKPGVSATVRRLILPPDPVSSP